jgi:Rrf2 family protein
MLTRKGKYGLKALIYLSQMPASEFIFVGDIAEANNIPKRFLDNIFSELRSAGIIQSRRGKQGGYRLAHPPREIKVGEVVRVLDGPLSPISCASTTSYESCADCDVDTCEVRHVMLNVRNAISGILDKRSIAQLRDYGSRNSDRQMDLML